MKTYVPVGRVERQTSHCPTYLAWIVLDEARDYCRMPIPERYADDLAGHAEAVFARHPFWRRKYQSVRGREFLLGSLRHWLAALLAQENPALFRELPEEFKLGHALPARRPARAKVPLRPVRISRPATRLVHGSELLAV